MSLYDFPNATQPDDILVQLQAQVPIFTPLLLAFVWFVIATGGITRSKAKTGTADYPMWCTLASLSTFLIALIMSVISGLINLTWLVIVVVVTIFSGIWLFLDRRSSEF